jgi:hypothetical protein
MPDLDKINLSAFDTQAPELDLSAFDVKKKDGSVGFGTSSSPTPSKLPSKNVFEQGLQYAQQGYKMPISDALREDINKKEDTGAALYNTLVGSATRLAGGLDYLVKSNIQVPQELPKEILKARPDLAGNRFETANESRKRIESFVEQARSAKSSKEYESKLGEFDITPKKGGKLLSGIDAQDFKALAFQAPSQALDMVLGGVTGGMSFVAQSASDAAKDLENNPEASKLTDYQKSAYIYTQAAVQAALEKLSLDVILGKTGLGKKAQQKIANEIVEDFASRGIKATAKDVQEAAVRKATNLGSKIKRLGLKTALGTVSEGVTEGTQTAAQQTIKLFTNTLTKKEIFDEEDILANLGKDILNSAVQGGAFGGGASFGVGSLQNTNKAIRNEIANGSSGVYIKDEINKLYADGKISEQEAKYTNDKTDQYEKIAEGIPADIAPDDKYKIIGGIEQKDVLEAKKKELTEEMNKLDPVFRKEKQDQIDLIQAKIDEANDYLEGVIDGKEVKYKEKDGNYYKIDNNGEEVKITKENYELAKAIREEDKRKAEAAVIMPEEVVQPETIEITPEEKISVITPEENIPVETVEVTEAPKTATDKLAAFREKYNLVSESALKGAETKRINEQAAKIVPTDTESAVLAWLAGKGNELNWKAINDAAGSREGARLNVGRDYSTGEVKARDYASKERNKGLELTDAAHKIWQEISKKNPNISSDQVEEVLRVAIRENPTRLDAARTLVARSGAETAPISIEEGEQAYYESKGEPEVIVEQTPEGYKWEGGFVPFEEEDIEGIEEAPFAVQEPTTDEVNDMKDIVKDLINEGVLNLSKIKSRVAKELGYDSKRLRQTIEDAYQEYTKEFTPKEITSGVLGKVGTFLSDLFGGKARDRVFIAKDGKSLMAKYNQIAETGGRVEFQATLGDDQTVTVKPVDASVVNGFYSPLELQINQMKQDKMPAKQWLDKLRGEEAKWSGLSDWLSQQEGSLTKQEVKDWLNDNRIEINEIVKGDPDIYNKSLWKYQAAGDGIWTFNFERGGYLKIDASEGDNFARLYVQEPRRSAYENEIASVQYYDRDQILDIALENDYFENYIDNEILSSTKYGKYTVEGDKSDYKEILITLPVKSKTNLQEKIDQLDDLEQDEINKERNKYVSELGLDPDKKQLYFFAINDDNDVIYLAKDADDLDKWKDSHLYAMSVQQEAPAGLKNALQFNKYFNVTNDALEKIRIKINDLEKEINKKDKTDTKYKSSHFDEANILVHVRSDIRTDSKGNKIYFIEEVQSDWGQEGKKKGFVEEISSKDLERYEELKPIVKKLDDTDNDIRQASIYANGGIRNQEGLDISKFLSLPVNERKSKVKSVHNKNQTTEYNVIDFLKKEIEKNNKEVDKKIDQQLLLEKELNKYEKFLETVKNNREFDQANEEWNNIFKEIRKLKSEQQNLEELTFGLNKEIAKANERIGFDNFYYEKALKSSDLEFDSVEYFKIKNEYQKLNDKIIDKEGINKAPFVTKTNDWAKLGLKVALKNAVESGASKIAWTNGEQQNERYDLSKQVNYIERIPENDINKEQGDFYLDINLPNGIIGLNVNKDSGIVTRSTGSVYRGDLIGKPLSDVIGKDMADKIMSGGAKKYEGDGLKIGGKGMIGFYGSPKDNSLGILGDLAKSLYKQTPEKLILDNYREAKLKELQKELDEHTANKTSDFRLRDFHLQEASDAAFNSLKEERLYNLEQADYYEKRAKAKAEIEESVLREIKRLGVEYQYSINITPELKAQVEQGLPMFMSDPNGDVLGFSFQNKVYLNGEKLNPNTPIHEAGHIWTDWVRQNDPKIYERGMQLIEGSDYLKKAKASRFYQKEALKLSSKAEVEQYFKNEALAMAIGDKGAQFVTESKKASFKEWLNTLWSKIKEVVGFRDISPEELQDLTLDQFAKMAVKDILGEQFETRPVQQSYDLLPKGKKLRQSKEETLIKNNFENIVNELIKKKKIQKIC